MSKLRLRMALVGVGFGLSQVAHAQDAAVTPTADGGYKVEIKRAAPPAPAPAPAKGDAAEAPAPAPAAQAGGYSWKDPAPRKRSRVRINPNWAIATFPGFRMHQDGSSEISVWLSKKVNVEVRKADRTVTLVLKDTYVRWATNTLPLITRHFNTPLSSARLKRGKAGETLLVIQLRETADVQSKLEVGPRGTAILRVQLPKPVREFVKADQRAPLAVLPRQ